MRAAKAIHPVADVMGIDAGSLQGVLIPPYWRMPTPRDVRLEIVKSVADRHHVSESELLGPGRRRALFLARAEAMAEIRRLYGDSLPQIGRLFGRDHSSVMNALKRFREQNHAR